MQTSLAITSHQLQPPEQGMAASLMPRVLDRGNSEAALRSQSNIAPLEFVSRTKDRKPLASEKIEESIAYMARNLNRPLQVSTLASLVNVSPSHYFALFKRHTGRAPIDYFTR